jgi:hypothetical protein
MSKKMNIISALSQKAEPITGYELNVLREAFEEKLNKYDKTKTQWCRENRIKDSTLSNALSGNIQSRPTVALVARYVLDTNWS